MERSAFRAWAALSPRQRRLAVGLGVALVGCSSAVMIYSDKAPPPSQRPPRVTSTAAVAASGLAAQKPIELEQFSPFAADPRYRDVASALESGQTRPAAEALQKIREREPNSDSPTVALWSGRLWERANEAGKALVACELATAPGAVLRDYGLLCRARALLALSREREAIAVLEQPAYSTTSEPERCLLEARAAKKLQDRPLSLRWFRQAAALASSAEQRARIGIELAETLLEGGAADSAVGSEALSLVRRASVTLAAAKAERQRLLGLERRALSTLPPDEQRRHAQPSVEERVLSLSALLEAREYELADTGATELVATLSDPERYSEFGCEARLIRAKALSGLRKFGAAVEALTEARDHCSADGERGARIWFLSGRYASSDSRYAQAIGFFGQVEQRYPSHSLADDARFNSAVAEEELGADARSTDLLLSLPDDYPTGDMAPEGLFRLALRRMERGAWADAMGLLERGQALLGDREQGRGFELSGRERFFHARALAALGKREQAMAELEALIQAYPLSYYMLEAYSWLLQLESARAEAAIQTAEEAAAAAPFHVAGRPELERPGFARVMDLLRIGELEAATRELDQLGLRADGVASEILWGVALLYERAGFSKFSAELTRRKLGEVAGRWPVGQWKRAWEIAFPQPYLEIVSREAEKSGIDVALAYAIMREESVFDPDAVSPANAYGLMQLIVPTARRAARDTNLPFGPEALKRPRVNIALGCRELSRLAALFTENPLLSVPAYNAGPGRAARWLRDRPSFDFDLWVERIPFLETRRYTKRVLSSRAIYAYLYQRESAPEHLRLPLKVGG